MHAMAEPGSAVEVHGSVTVDGTVAKRDPDALVAEIECRREDLALTIDRLAARVSPANNVRRLRETVLEQASRPEVQLAAAAVGLVLAAATIYRVFGRRKK
jgi:Protein of unknown function (DUF3618)